MTSRKARLTITVDPALVEAGQRAVAAGQADSVSGWVSAALEDRILRDTKLALLAAAVADYEDEFGEVTEEEITRQRRADRENAGVVRGRRRPATRATRSV
jgi:glycerol dehydrogenase-like iron-containing ADH family enzyme